MKCGFCDRIKNLRRVDVILIACICFFLYIGYQLQLKEYKAYKGESQKARENKQEKDKELQAYEDLQRKCYFKNDKEACELLKSYE